MCRIEPVCRSLPAFANHLQPGNRTQFGRLLFSTPLIGPAPSDLSRAYQRSQLLDNPDGGGQGLIAVGESHHVAVGASQARMRLVESVIAHNQQLERDVVRHHVCRRRSQLEEAGEQRRSVEE